MTTRERLERGLLLVGLGALGWLLMQALHEAGHVLHAALSGGQVLTVDLHPLRLSRTILGTNPHPRLVAWGGAVWGCALPLAGVALARVASAPAWAVAIARALAGLCLLANGVYLGAGGFVRAGDAGDLLLAGAWPASLVGFGLAASVGGLALWHGTGADLSRAPRAAAPVLLALAGAAAGVGAAACTGQP